MDYTKLTKAELIAALNKKDESIDRLEGIITQKNNELKGDNSKEELAKLKDAYNFLANKVNTMISDSKNFLQLLTSSTELMNSSLAKTIESLGVAPKPQPQPQPQRRR